MRLDAEDHRKVSLAIAEAERRTSGEILVVATAESDRYHDAVLHWAVLAALLVPALAALLPAVVRENVATALLGWHAEDGAARLLLLLAAQLLLFLVVRYAVGLTPLRFALTPAATRDRRVRRRAIAAFRVGAEARTAGRTGVLLYLSFAEHRAEIVADAAVHRLVPPEAWGEAMAILIDAVRDGRPGDGLAAAVGAIADLIAPHFPPGSGDVNEIPDRLIEV